MVSLSSFPSISGKTLVGAEKEEKVQAFETKTIGRSPDVVKGPPRPPRLDIYPAFIIGENIDRFRVGLALARLGGHELRLVGPVRECRETLVKVGILRDRKSSVVMVTIYKDEVPVNVGQPKRGD